MIHIGTVHTVRNDAINARAQRGVVGMIRQAKKNKTLYADLRDLGFGDNEFPDWWYSPARDVEVEQVAVSSSAIAVSRSATAVSRSNELSGAQDAPLRARNPSSRDRVSVDLI